MNSRADKSSESSSPGTLACPEEPSEAVADGREEEERDEEDREDEEEGEAAAADLPEEEAPEPDAVKEERETTET